MQIKYCHSNNKQNKQSPDPGRNHRSEALCTRSPLLMYYKTGYKEVEWDPPSLLSDGYREFFLRG
jgi:hypothetical protein